MPFLSTPISFSNQGYDLSQGTLTWLQYASLQSQVIFDSFGFELLLFVIGSKLYQPMKKVLCKIVNYLALGSTLKLFPLSQKTCCM